MSRQQALREARMEMGSSTAAKDKVYETGWESLVEGFWQDLRFACRMLPKNPGFTAVAVITLALGIGATATAYGWIEPIPLHPPSGLVPTTLSLKQECQKI